MRERAVADAEPARGKRRSDIALAGVYEISKLLTVPARLESSLAGVLQLLASFLDMRHGLIALLDDVGAPEVVVGSGWSEATARRYFARLPERAIGRIVVTKMPLVIQHMKQDSLFENWDFSEWNESDGEWSFIGVPIKDRGKVIGTMTIDRELGDGPYYSFDEDVRFLTMIANLIGQTVRLQRLIVRDRERLMDSQRRLEKTIEYSSSADERTSVHAGAIIGGTPQIRSVLEKVRRVARSDTPVLLRGESGTGKELIANALHELSPRNKGPFVAINCAALAESVLESELFGHEKGAFTGAVSQRRADSKWRTAERCFWTKSARSRRPSKQNYCACCSSENSSASAARKRSRWTFDWLPRPIEIWKRRWPMAIFAPICTTASTWSRFSSRRCANAGGTFPCWRASSSTASTPNMTPLMR